LTESENRPPVAPESPYPPPPPPAAPYPYSAQPQWPEGTWAGRTLAGWWGRVGASLLDALITTLLAAVAIGTGIGVGAATTELAGIPFYIVAALIWLFYAPVLMAREGEHNGQTLGKQAVGIAVVRENQQPMTFGWSFIREFVIKTVVFGWLGGSILIGYLLDVLWPLWDAENRALHDMLATTRVVQT
jgi:uncharacterized RDD family membrane protein YckC